MTSLSSKARSGIIRVLGSLEPSLSPPRTVQRSSSAKSLSLMERGEILLAETVSAAPPVVDFESVEVDPDEKEHGEVIERADGASQSGLTEQGRVEGSSLASLSSPILDHDDSTVASHAYDFPFSIDQPPLTDVLDEQLLTVPGPTVPEPAVDNRLRGDSISSIIYEHRRQRESAA